MSMSNIIAFISLLVAFDVRYATDTYLQAVLAKAAAVSVKIDKFFPLHCYGSCLLLDSNIQLLKVIPAFGTALMEAAIAFIPV